MTHSLIHVEDPSDSIFDLYRNLNTTDRRDDGMLIAEGSLVVERLVNSHCEIHSIIGFEPKLSAFLAEHHVNVPVISTTRTCLAEVAGFDLHRGLVAAAYRPQPRTVASILATARTVVIAEGVADHENIGSLFRNAAGLGVDGIIFGPGCADPLYRRCLRVSMGHVLRLPFAHCSGTRTTWQRELEDFRAAGFRLVSLTPNPAVPHLSEALLDATGRPYDKIALLIGAEGPGLTEHAMRATDIRARIPMAPGTDSLNVATAAAVALYERARSLSFS